MTGDFLAGRRHYQDAVDLARGLRRTRETLRYLNNLTWAGLQAGLVDESGLLLEEMLPLARREKDIALRMNVLDTLGMYALARDDLELDQVDVKGMRVARDVGDLPQLGRPFLRRLGRGHAAPIGGRARHLRGGPFAVAVPLGVVDQALDRFTVAVGRAGAVDVGGVPFFLDEDQLAQLVALAVGRLDVDDR